MRFAKWFNETSLRDILSPVPQSPKHHSEGDVFAHSKLVRQQLSAAIAHFQELVKSDPVFSNFNPEITPEDIKLLKIAAWQHDIGKASATAVDGQPWQNASITPTSKITAYDHQAPHHFEPMMQKLGNPWPNMYQNAPEADKQDLWFVIKHHMDLRLSFSKKLMPELIENGKFKNERKVKLLLILMMMDQTGRIKLDGMRDSLHDITGKMSQSATDYTAKQRPIKKPDMSSQELFADLQKKGLDSNRIAKIMQAKYGATWNQM